MSRQPVSPGGFVGVLVDLDEAVPGVVDVEVGLVVGGLGAGFRGEDEVAGGAVGGVDPVEVAGNVAGTQLPLPRGICVTAPHETQRPLIAMTLHPSGKLYPEAIWQQDGL